MFSISLFQPGEGLFFLAKTGIDAGQTGWRNMLPLGQLLHFFKILKRLGAFARDRIGNGKHDSPVVAVARAPGASLLFKQLAQIGPSGRFELAGVQPEHVQIGLAMIGTHTRDVIGMRDIVVGPRGRAGIEIGRSSDRRLRIAVRSSSAGPLAGAEVFVFPGHVSITTVAEFDAAMDALRHESLFNVIETASGWKIDLIFRKSRAFDREEFGRRRQATFFEVQLFVASAEDVIISKLEWSKLGGSQRQIEDVAKVLSSRWKVLDQNYLSKWIDELQLNEQWSAAKQFAEIA